MFRHVCCVIFKLRYACCVKLSNEKAKLNQVLYVGIVRSIQGIVMVDKYYLVNMYFTRYYLSQSPPTITPTTHLSPLTTHLSPLTTHYSPLTTHHLSPLTSHLSPLTTHHTPLTTYNSPPTTYHPPHTTHHLQLTTQPHRL